MKPENHRRIYLLNPKELSPETIAVTFAKTSRSPQSFDEIAAELTDERSAQFHEKWVVGYGHASVAEHAVLHVAIENVSRLAVESLESNRLASYTEKSTRYQTWRPDAFALPPELEDHPLQDEYLAVCRKLFETYQAVLPRLRETLEKRDAGQPGERDSARERRLQSQAVDVARFLLPAAALANLGVTANARVLEHAIQKLLSHPLAEVRAVGAEIKRTAQAEVPTLVKYADAVPYLSDTAEALRSEAGQIPTTPQPQGEWCRLVDFDPQGEERVLAAALFRFGEMRYADAWEYVHQIGKQGRVELARQVLSRLARHDIPLRELEYTDYTFEVNLDQGAYFELKRHRMMSQTPQALSTRLGYSLPRLFVEAGVDALYRDAMQSAAQAYERLAEVNPEVAAYVVPNGCYRRVLIHFNLRTAFHLCALRSAENAHFSMRRMALCLAEQIRAVHPALGAYGLTQAAQDWREVERANFVE